MQFTRTGFILYVMPYEECVAFYRDIVGLRQMFETPDLTTFVFGGSYLMVEREDEDHGGAGQGRYATCLRMNLPDVRAMADRLIAAGVDVDYQEHDWGTVAKFVDPAGNLCAFKDDATFEAQVAGG
ncbi:VOC family protein [Sphingomicrobium arenosum]|uniref:VOC family protein n=1 Tax=Sphingomicrobium arenosum TaxID=2233861 RepID=UPI0022400419|nr:VOC family protein [Sphingomicrobium arenosum]